MRRYSSPFSFSWAAGGGFQSTLRGRVCLGHFDIATALTRRLLLAVFVSKRSGGKFFSLFLFLCSLIFSF